jgi:cellulose synthase/poly-beta-1,6-N-acetylglucosamine synthase-like glycosyltransferase
MEWMTILALCSGGFYLLVNVGLAVGLWRRRMPPSDRVPPVSVIVAARNEERTLPQLLDRLAAQSYPNLEIIIVNDRSTDGTGAAIEAIQSSNPRFKRIDITAEPDDMPAKKNALRAGIANSRGEILCFTDADCLPGPEWVASLVQCFDERTGMVAGFSPYSGFPEVSEDLLPFFRRWFYRFISYEEFRGAVWAGGSIGWNCAWLCTGRNLAYRRSVYAEVGGFEGIKRSVSGDDDLFMQEVRRRTSWAIRFCYDARNQVETYPPRSLRAFVEQRKRHFSAGKFFTLPMKTFFASYHTANLVLLGSFIGAVFVPAMWPLLIPAGGLKIISDAVLAASGSAAFQEPHAVRRFLPMEVLYVVYNWIIGPLGFLTTFRWKAAE